MNVPETVRRTAQSRGPGWQAWLDGLPGVVDGLARAWSLTVGDVLEGGSWALVVTVRRADGTDAVLKLAPPDGLLAGEVATLTAADGHGYARVHAYDPDRRAVLLEALGPPIPTDGPERVLDVSAATLRAAWRAPILGEPGPHKAARLIELIGTLWAELGEPCPRPLIDQSIGYARRRLDAAPTAPRVWCHGDPHPANLLAVRAPRPGAGSGYVFVDPEGFACEPAYDLGVVVRDWVGEVLAAGDPRGLLRSYCARLADATGVPAAAIWEWGFVERVSSGLYLLSLGHADEGRGFLRSAELLLAGAGTGPGPARSPR
ncbi:aminoglycoside phosphotransferase family protein [Luedemannella flava]|uniref:Aminoglycoside phosphotransferase family protein n=1 Tax=Luedemannella flava TaxID=349316 RepID=A0ABP4YIM7_9ACTN